MKKLSQVFPHYVKALNLRALVIPALLLAVWVSPAAAEEAQQKLKWGVEAQALSSGGGANLGFGGGVRSVHYFGLTNVYAGFQALGGTVQGGNFGTDHFTYGGLNAGFDTTLLRFFTFDVAMLAGYGYGAIGSQGISGQGLALQPTGGIGLVLLNGWRVTFCVGYLFFPSNHSFSGMTYGIRLDHKTWDRTKSLDD